MSRLLQECCHERRQQMPFWIRGFIFSGCPEHASPVATTALQRSPSETSCCPGGLRGFFSVERRVESRAEREIGTDVVGHEVKSSRPPAPHRDWLVKPLGNAG